MHGGAWFFCLTLCITSFATVAAHIDEKGFPKQHPFHRIGTFHATSVPSLLYGVPEQRQDSSD